uniref:variable large family protein n=1 Tax=Borreliella garinii TaxID=29519 RepID=UPI001AEED7FD
MKKISSVMFLAAFLIFINCKNNAGKASDDKNDSASIFYQSIIKLGNGFLDVFTSFGGLVADTFGLKADPKKSDVKEHFSSIAKTLEETKKNIDSLSKENNSTSQKVKSNGDGEGSVEAAVAKLGELLTEIAKAAQGIAGKIEG